MCVFPLKLGESSESYIALTHGLARVYIEAATHVSTRIQFVESAHFFPPD